VQALPKKQFLRGVTFESCWKLTDAGILNLITCSNLWQLTLDYCEQITDGAVGCIALLPKLQTLNLSYSQHLTDTALKSINKMKALKEVTISRTTAMTHEHLQTLKKKEEVTVRILPLMCNPTAVINHLQKKRFAALRYGIQGSLDRRIENIKIILKNHSFRKADFIEKYHAYTDGRHIEKIEFYPSLQTYPEQEDKKKEVPDQKKIVSKK
jgi:hypothetical protein